MSGTVRTAAQLLVLQHEGFKAAIDGAPTNDGPMLHLLKMFAQLSSGVLPGDCVDMQPVRFMQLVRPPHRGQSKMRVEDLDMTFAQFAAQPADHRRCVNPTCGRQLTEETAQSATLSSQLASTEYLLHTVIIAFVCKTGDCQAQYSKALCDFLTIKTDQMRQGKLACDGCKQLSFSIDYKLCGECKQAQYCNVTCQRTHWPEHRLVCRDK